MVVGTARTSVPMYAATAGLIAVSLAIAVFAGPLAGMTERAGADLLDREPYRVAVLGADVDERPSGWVARLAAARASWLTLVWVLLWGTFTVASLVGGVVVAVLVTAAVPAAAGHRPAARAPAARCSGSSGT